ncbi:MAG: hypothetical protein Q9212_006268 [Teloschistes hypoglaucus]
MLLQGMLLALMGTAWASPLMRKDTNTTSATSVPPSNPPIPDELYQKLLLAPTAEDRIAILQAQGPADTWLKYDFNPAANPNPGGGKGLGGQGDLANRKTFPALTNLGVAMSAGFMNPCGMNKPHIHPRATEFLTLAKGANVKTGFILENGLTDQMSTTLSLFQGALFPQGSIHYEFNDNCEPAVFLAAFSNEDPGLSTIGKNFFALDPDVVDADLGFPDHLDGTNIREFDKAIPKSFALGPKECLKRCGIKY